VASFAALLAAPIAAAQDREYDFSLVLFTPLAINDIQALRQEAEIATQDDSLLGEIIVYCGNPTLPTGCWADTERLGEMDAITVAHTRDDLLMMEFTVGRIVGLIEIAHGTPDPL
jgi:hypothetical protein